MQPDDEASRDLFVRSQAGDGDAFEQLVRGYSRQLRARIHSRLGRRLRSEIEVEDVEQETLLKAFTSLRRAEWRGRKSFFRWMAEIAEHVMGQVARRRFISKKRGAGLARAPRSLLNGDSSDSTPVSPGPSPIEVLRRSERFERLEKALAILSDEHRQVILLARIEELPIKKIAEKMNRSPDAVSMLLHRALRRLREVFGNTDSFLLPPHASCQDNRAEERSRRDSTKLEGPKAARQGN